MTLRKVESCMTNTRKHTHTHLHTNTHMHTYTDMHIHTCELSWVKLLPYQIVTGSRGLFSRTVEVQDTQSEAGGLPGTSPTSH